MVDDGVLQKVRSHMRSVRSPGAHDKVYKEECMYSYDTPESPGGIFINLQTFQGFGSEFVGLDHHKTGNALYLHEKWNRVPLSAEEQAQQEEVSKLAIGVEGGFQVDKEKYKIEKQHALVILPEKTIISLPCPDLPEIVLQAVKAVIEHESASLQETVATWEEERKVSRYAEDLPQLDTGRLISPDPKEWKCDETGVTENLWLNLSTGFVGSGRQHWDGTGGNGAALRHFEATGKKYPLVVKLGTITPQGADVYSYAEDESDMVDDPWLDKHLAHWGINMGAMRKSEKTMAELQVELNMSYEFDRITESGSALRPLSGPGFVGLVNLGNSCYMNSVLQVLMTIPQLQQRYVSAAPHIFETAADPSADLPTQLAKVGVALVNGRTGKDPQHSAAESKVETVSVRPQSFKTLVGKGHSEFSSARQQDAAEYFQHLLELIGRTEHANAQRLEGAGQEPTSSAFTFQLEDRVQCIQSGRVSYQRSTTNMLSVGIPLEAATNLAEVQDYKEREAKRQKLKEEQADAYIGSGDGEGAVQADSREEPVIPQVPFEACLEQWGASETMEDYHSAALGRKTLANKRTRVASFPPYLLVQMKRYYVARDWTPKKLEVLVEVPDHLSLEHLRGTGPAAGEQLQPEEPEAAPAAAAAAAPAAPERVEPSPELVSQLVAMGFSENGSKRAVAATHNSGAEAAMEWVLGHMEDADFNDPLPEPAPAAAAAGTPTSGPTADPEQLAMLTAMGFTDRQAEAAFKACNGSIERAGDWLFSHMDDMDAAVEAVLAPAATGGAAATGAAAAAAPAAKVLDGKGEYSLVAFISHMGSNTACGHYVCHVKKGDKWVIYNDEKVAESESPPRDLGYLYLFKRDDE